MLSKKKTGLKDLEDTQPISLVKNEDAGRVAEPRFEEVSMDHPSQRKPRAVLQDNERMTLKASQRSTGIPLPLQAWRAEGFQSGGGGVHLSGPGEAGSPHPVLQWQGPHREPPAWAVSSGTWHGQGHLEENRGGTGLGRELRQGQTWSPAKSH